MRRQPGTRVFDAYILGNHEGVQKLRVQQLIRTNRSLQEVKQGQEMDMEANRNIGNFFYLYFY